MAFSIVTLVRLALLATVTFFSLIVLGTAAHILSASTFVGIYWTFDAFAVAVSVLTIVTLAVLLTFSLISKGAFPNYVVVEFACLTVLWVLWLSSAAYSANSLSILPSGCSFNINFATSLTNRQTVNCGEFWALEAFSWLNWIMLMPYTILLLVLTIVQQNRGNNVWTQCVHEVDFFAPRAGGVMQPGMVPQSQMYSPQPMVQQPLPQQGGQYPTGPPTVGYATPPVQHQTPMNTGYAQPPANTGYAAPPVQQQSPMNTGYAQPPANTGYSQAPVNTEYAQAPYVPAPGYAQGSPNPGYTQV